MNKNNIKILTRFLIFLSVLLFICFYGIAHPKAYVLQDFKWLNRYSFPFTTNYEPYTYNAQYFWFNPNSGLPNYFIVNGCATGGLSFDIRNVVDGDISYIGSISFPEQTCSVSGYTGVKVRYYFKLSNWSISNTQAAITYGVRVENTSNWTVYVNFEDYTFSDTSDFEVLTQQQETTNSIISSSSANTQDIINNNNTNASAIIDNQNENTQQQIESQKVCNDKTYELTVDNAVSTRVFLDSSGSIASLPSGNLMGISEYIPFSSGDIIIANSSASMNSAAFCFYDKNKTLVSCESYARRTNITKSVNYDGYARFSVLEGTTTSVRIHFCQNGNQALNDELNNLNDSLTDTTPVDMSNLGDVAGWLPAGPIDSIINLPLTFMNNLYTALNSTCSPLHIPIPYLTNKFIDIPCISTIYSQINGFDIFWNWVGGIASVLILYKYLLALYKYYDDLTTLKANFISDFGGAP